MKSINDSTLRLPPVATRQLSSGNGIELPMLLGPPGPFPTIAGWPGSLPEITWPPPQPRHLSAKSHKTYRDVRRMSGLAERGSRPLPSSLISGSLSTELTTVRKVHGD